MAGDFPMLFRLCGACSLVAASLGCASVASAQDLQAERQATLDMLLTTTPLVDVGTDREHCASGDEPEAIAHSRSLGALSLPDASDYCITVLIRLARNGGLAPIRDANAAETTGAVALDTGFIAAYARSGAAPVGLPEMDTLKPIAERCLAQAEPNIRLCYSTGFAFGARASQGEVVRVR